MMSSNATFIFDVDLSVLVAVKYAGHLQTDTRARAQAEPKRSTN